MNSTLATIVDLLESRAFVCPPERLLTMNDELRAIVGPAWRDHLTCPICMDLYASPAALNCQHTFCTSCISKWIETRGGERLIPCPVCKLFVARDLTPNFQVRQVVMDLVEVSCPECPWKGSGIKSYQEHIAQWCPSVMQKNVADLTRLLEEERVKNDQYAMEVQELNEALLLAGAVVNSEDEGETKDSLKAELVAARSDLADAVTATHTWQARGLRQHEMFSDLLWKVKRDMDRKESTIRELQQQLHDAQGRPGHRARLHSRSPRRSRNYNDRARHR